MNIAIKHLHYGIGFDPITVLTSWFCVVEDLCFFIWFWDIVSKSWYGYSEFIFGCIPIAIYFSGLSIVWAVKMYVTVWLTVRLILKRM